MPKKITMREIRAFARKYHHSEQRNEVCLYTYNETHCLVGQFLADNDLPLPDQGTEENLRSIGMLLHTSNFAQIEITPTARRALIALQNSADRLNYVTLARPSWGEVINEVLPQKRRTNA